jgi:hypothetical protein
MGLQQSKGGTEEDVANCRLRVLDVQTAAGVYLSPISGLKPIAIVSLAVACVSIEAIVDGVQNKAQASLYFAQNHISPAALGSTSHDESGSITLYTEGWIPAENSLYHILNRLLCDSDRSKLIPFFPYLKLLLTALLRQPRYTGSVWRGVTADLRPQYPKGSKQIWWSFSSCTTEMSALESDLFLGKSGTRTLFRIDNCTRAVDIQKFSVSPTEAEVLLIPGAHLEVVDVGDMDNGLVIITLKQILPPFDAIDFDWDDYGNDSALDEIPVQPAVEFLEQQLTNIGFSKEDVVLGAQHGQTVQQASNWLLNHKQAAPPPAPAAPAAGQQVETELLDWYLDACIATEVAR